MKWVFQHLAFLSFPLSWSIFFYTLIFNLYVSFELRLVSFRQHIVDFFLIQSYHLCLLNGVFCPLTFKVIIDKYVFIDILNLIFQLILFLFFFFLAGWFPFILCLCPLLFVFCLCVCQSNVYFWFVIALFFRSVNPFLYLLALNW